MTKNNFCVQDLIFEHTYKEVGSPEPKVMWVIDVSKALKKF
jgi:hypothetical protein